MSTLNELAEWPRCLCDAYAGFKHPVGLLLCKQPMPAQPVSTAGVDAALRWSAPAFAADYGYWLRTINQELRTLFPELPEGWKLRLVDVSERAELDANNINTTV